jgi:hypothetical protein
VGEGLPRRRLGGGGLPNVRMMFREGIKVSCRIEPDYAKTLAEPRSQMWEIS